MAKRRFVSTSQLDGGLPLSTLIHFRDRSAFKHATDNLSNDVSSVLAIRSPISQFLIASGETMFKEMLFTDLRRLQLDIETLGLDPTVPDAEVIMVALRQGTFEEVLIQESTEADLLERLVTVLSELDPDVIEGHNIFLFDLLYLIERGLGKRGSRPDRPRRIAADAIPVPQ